MNAVWCGLFLTCCTISMLTGQASDAAGAVLQSGEAAVKLALALMGSMVLWSGLMEILAATGDVERLGKGLRRVLAPLFPDLQDEGCWAAMGMNMAANMLGLGNAATPAGIRAAQLLEKQGCAGLQALAMLLALNNSSLQLMPTTVITLRGAAGSAAPADIWPAVLVSSGAATLAAGALMLLANRGGARRG